MPFAVYFQNIIGMKNLKPSESPSALRIIYKNCYVDFPWRGLTVRKTFILKKYKGKYVCMTKQLLEKDGRIIFILVLDDVCHEYPT